MDENKNRIESEEILNEAEEMEQEVAAPEQIEEAESEVAAEDCVVEAPSYEEPVLEEEKKGKGGKKLLVAACAVIGAVAILLAVAAVLFNSPLGTVAKGAKNTYDSLKKNEVVALATGVVKGGSVEAVADLEKLTESMMGYGVEGTASVKLYSSNKPALGVVGSLELDGDDLLDVTAVLSKDEFALASNSLLGDKAYGIKFGDILVNFEDSLFGPDGLYSLGIELEEIESILTAVEDSAGTSKDAKAILMDMTTAAVKSIQKHTEIEKGKETITFGNEDCKTTTVTINADAVAIINVLNDMLVYLSTDGDLQDFLYANADQVATMASNMSYAEYDGDELVDEFYEVLDDAIAQMEDAMEEAEDEDIEIAAVFYVSKSGSYLVGIELKVESYGDKTKMDVFAGPSLEDLSEISFRYDDGYSKIKGSYTVKTNDGKAYTATLKIKESNETVFSGAINWDKKAGDLEIEFSDSWDSYKLDCDMSHSSKETVISVKSFDDGYDDYDIGVDVTLKSSDKMPSISKYTDILTMDEDDLEDVMYDVIEMAEEISYFMY